ncbi:hypothetical protein BDY24DRAFT_419481 [Mrakia frigida]|uniref:uncharacterized protein n=1 Tax=Mrakia frigida TaxID=29902 RepID=UPI003FCC0006
MALEAITNGDNDRLANGSRPSDKTTILGTLLVVRDDFLATGATEAQLLLPPKELAKAAYIWCFTYCQTRDGVKFTQGAVNPQVQFVTRVHSSLAEQMHLLATTSSVWRTNYNERATQMGCLSIHGIATFTVPLLVLLVAEWKAICQQDYGRISAGPKAVEKLSQLNLPSSPSDIANLRTLLNGSEAFANWPSNYVLDDRDASNLATCKRVLGEKIMTPKGLWRKVDVLTDVLKYGLCPVLALFDPERVKNMRAGGALRKDAEGSFETILLARITFPETGGCEAGERDNFYRRFVHAVISNADEMLLEINALNLNETYTPKLGLGAGSLLTSEVFRDVLSQLYGGDVGLLVHLFSSSPRVGAIKETLALPSVILANEPSAAEKLVEEKAVAADAKKKESDKKKRGVALSAKNTLIEKEKLAKSVAPSSSQSFDSPSKYRLMATITPQLDNITTASILEIIKSNGGRRTGQTTTLRKSIRSFLSAVLLNVALGTQERSGTAATDAELAQISLLTDRFVPAFIEMFEDEELAAFAQFRVKSTLLSEN